MTADTRIRYLHYMKRLTKESIISLLRKKQGDRSAKELAADLGVTPQYLSDVFLGRREPGPAILRGLRLEAEITYIPAEERAK